MNNQGEQMVSIGARLREEREALQLSQEAFGTIAGVTKKSQINYEKNERSPDSNYLAAIAAAGADVLYILTGQRVGSTTTTPTSVQPISKGDRILLDNFHAAPEQVQAGVKTALGAFAPASAGGKRGKAA